MFDANVKIIAELKVFIAIVAENNEIKQQFCISDKDFTRTRKLPFEKIVLVIALCLAGISMHCLSSEAMGPGIKLPTAIN